MAKTKKQIRQQYLYIIDNLMQGDTICLTTARAMQFRHLWLTHDHCQVRADIVHSNRFSTSKNLEDRISITTNTKETIKGSAFNGAECRLQDMDIEKTISNIKQRIINKNKEPVRPHLPNI